MLKETANIVIQCPPEKVFDFISDARNRPHYDFDLIEIRVTPDGPPQVGTRIVEVRKMLGVKGESVTEVFRLEPGKVVGFRSLEGDPLNAHGTYEVTVEAGGTRLTLDFNIEPKGLVKLLIPFIGAGLKRDIAKGLRNTKGYLEKNQ